MQRNNDDDEDISTVDYKNIKTQKHFALIQNLSRLLCKQTVDIKHKFFCGRCLNNFKTTNSLEKHMINCQNLNKTKITLPTKNQSILKF